ncbi:hypothetical protein GGS21DRAFT_64020 [Xylaria nigripes]|nr:hypothetical protein GGS21DRAFT_64020 [Xylaria nigripes]
MGSLAKNVDKYVYPDALDPSLVLTHPTAAEKDQTWRMNFVEWGGALDLNAYLGRELLLNSTPLTINGGMTHWILTQPLPSGEDGKRNILASAETIRKRVLYVPSDGTEVREGLGYGIGSVYTYPELRGRKYAARMLKELGMALRTWPKEEQQLWGKASDVANGTNEKPRSGKQPNGHTQSDKGEAKEAVCSALWSDIGKQFYASKGWPAYESDHVEFPCPPLSSPDAATGISSLFERSKHRSLTLTPVNEQNVAQLCRDDEEHLRAELIRHARETHRTAFAFAPTPDVMRWHWAREDFVASHVFPDRQPGDVKGMIATVGPAAPSHASTNGAPDKDKTRMWAIWTRPLMVGADDDAAKNTLYFMRFVIEKTPADRQALQLGFNAILQAALDAARTWHCGTVRIWNPDAQTKELIDGSGVPHSYVHRDMSSIPSMMWYGSEADEKVDWIANDRSCWC